VKKRVEEISMLKTLLAVDGSDGALRATRELIEAVALYKEPLEVELVTVQLPVPPVGGFSSVVVSGDMVNAG
jgi:hypothetical protein